MFCTAEVFPKGKFLPVISNCQSQIFMCLFFIWLRFFVANFGDRIHDCMYVRVGQVAMVLEHV